MHPTENKNSIRGKTSYYLTLQQRTATLSFRNTGLYAFQFSSICLQEVKQEELKFKYPANLFRPVLFFFFVFFVTSQNNMNLMDTSILAHLESIRQHINKTLLKQ